MEDINIYDVIVFEENLHLEEIIKDLRVGSIVDQPTKEIILSIIKDFWDYFCKEVVKGTIIGYVFSIFTGNAKPVCCNNASYEPN